MKLCWQRIKTVISRRTIIFSWIRATLAVIAAFIVLIIISYGLVTDLIEEQIAAINSGIAAQIHSRFETQLLEITTISIEIRNAPYASAVISSEAAEIPFESHAFREMVDYFRVTEATHTYIESISLARPGSDMVITSDGVLKWSLIMSADEFTKKIIEFELEMKAQPSWKNFAWIVDPCNCLYFIQSFSVFGRDEPVILLIKLNSEHQTEILNTTRSKYGGSFYITSGAGSVVFSSALPADSVLFRNEKFQNAETSWSGIVPEIGAVAFLKSDLSNLFCWSVIPADLFLSDINRLRNAFLGVSFAVVVFCVGFLLYFIFVHYLPLRKILSGFDADADFIPADSNEYERIELYSRNLLSRNKINMRKLSDFEGKIKNQYLQKLLKGMIKYSDLPESINCRIPLKAADKSYVLVHIKMPGSGFPSEVLSLFILEITSDIPSAIDFIDHVYFDDAVFILMMIKNRISSSLEHLMEYLTDRHELMTRRSGYSPLIVVSPTAASLENINQLYIACRLRAEEAEFFLQQTVLRAEPETDTELVFLNDEIQNQFSGQIFSGDCAGACFTIEKTIKNIEDRGVTSIDAVKCLLFSIFTVLIQTVSRTPAGNKDFFYEYKILMNKFFCSEDIISMKEVLCRVVCFSCDEISAKRNDRSNRLYEDILDYVSRNYSDKQMYLPSIAEAFGMNPKYLTVFFKDNHGKGLASYIREKRIEEACVLLKTDLPIKQISVLTGFASIISFNRTFKKLKSVTPSEFRQNYLKTKSD